MLEHKSKFQALAPIQSKHTVTEATTQQLSTDHHTSCTYKQLFKSLILQEPLLIIHVTIVYILKSIP